MRLRHRGVADGDADDRVRRRLDDAVERIDLGLDAERAIDHIDDHGRIVAERGDDAGELLFGPIALGRVKNDGGGEPSRTRRVLVLFA